MGQSSSSTARAGAQNDEAVSGVALDPSLEDTIVREFSNQTLQSEWDQFRQEVLARRSEKVQQKAQALQASQQGVQQEIAATQQKLQANQKRMDDSRAQFADTSIAMQYDAQRLLEQVAVDTANERSKPLSSQCLGERAHWMDCSTKYAADARPCNAYLAALEACVQRTVLTTTTTSA